MCYVLSRLLQNPRAKSGASHARELPSWGERISGKWAVALSSGQLELALEETRPESHWAHWRATPRVVDPWGWGQSTSRAVREIFTASATQSTVFRISSLTPELLNWNLHFKKSSGGLHTHQSYWRSRKGTRWIHQAGKQLIACAIFRKYPGNHGAECHCKLSLMTCGSTVYFRFLPAV
jgi:hypothetical protein